MLYVDPTQQGNIQSYRTAPNRYAECCTEFLQSFLSGVFIINFEYTTLIHFVSFRYTP